MTRPFVVTGAAGFIGSHVTRALVAEGERVVATDLPASLPGPVLAGLDASSVTYVPGDLRRDETLDSLAEAAGEPANVVHAAALLRFAEMAAALGQGAPSFPDALEVFEVNAMATWRLCSRFATPGMLGRFVYVSTRSVFGGLMVDAVAIPESSPPSPIGIYGSAKTAAEFGVLAFRDVFGLDLAVARVTGVYGPWQGTVSWVGKAVEGVLAGTGYRVATGGEDRYELTYIKDTARGLVDLARAETLARPIYHVSSGEMFSLNEVSQAFRSADPDAIVEFGTGSQPGMRGRLPLDGSAIAAELGFRARWDLKAAIADYLAVERSGSYGAEVLEPAGDAGAPGGAAG